MDNETRQLVRALRAHIQEELDCFKPCEIADNPPLEGGVALVARSDAWLKEDDHDDG